jgi:replicative DNA helicase
MPPRWSRRQNNVFTTHDGTPLEHGDQSEALKAEADSALLRNVPPHSVEAEQAVLGAILFKSSSLSDIAVIIRPDDFYIPANRTIFAACLALADMNAPVDAIALKNYLEDNSRLEEAGGVVYLTTLGEIALSSARGEYYAGIVRDKAQTRELIKACAGIITDAYEPGLSAKDLMDSSEQKIMEVSLRRTDHPYISFKDATRSVFDEITKRAQSSGPLTGVNTGYPKLNDITGGLQRSNLIVIAARPGMGKTALGLNLAVHAAMGDGEHTPGVPVAYFSLEMSMLELTQRMLCSEGLIDLSHMRKSKKPEPDDWNAMRWAAEKLSKASEFIIDDTAGLTIDALRSKVRRLWRREKIKLVVVDYLQLMTSSRHTYSREQEVAEISRGLKSLAKELDLPVVALAQLSREAVKREKDDPNARPKLSDLRESGAIEQDADLVLLINNHKEPKDPKERLKPRTVLIEIAKHRNGSTGDIYLQYLPRFTRFDPPLSGDQLPGSVVI